MRFAKTLAALCLCAAAASLAAQMPAQEMGAPPPFNLDMAVTHHALADELATRSGRRPQEIMALLRNTPPPQVAEQLRLDRETVHAAMKAARQSAVQKALAAGLIDADDAKRIQKADVERQQRREGGRQERGMRGPQSQGEAGGGSW